MKYSAFISYNHRDRKVASWLHSALETYRIPKALWGRESPLGVLGKRMPPVFQDREELAASTDLAGSVLEALEQSASLIVICTPNGRRSRWVNEEIRTFTKMGRRHRIQCLIAGGEPNASNVAGMDPELEALPPALFENGETEPLGADIRDGQDGKLNGKLKLLAGLLDVRYDELRQREAIRRQRQLTMVAAGSAAGFVVMSGLTAAALLQRAEAIKQRDIARQKTLTAERTVEFVKSIFTVSDPSEARGASVTAREILDRGARQIEGELMDEPSVKTELSVTLGEVYMGLGLYRQGEALVRSTFKIPGRDRDAVVRQLAALGDAQSKQSDFAGAVKSYGAALAEARKPDNRREEMVPRVLVGLAEAQASNDDFTGAARSIEEALRLDLARLGPDHPDVARDLETQGLSALYSGELERSQGLYLRALQIRERRQGERHPKVAEDLNQLGSIAYLRRDGATAEKYFRRVMATNEAVLGPMHPDLATTLNNVGRVLLERRAFSEANAIFERSLAITLQQRGETFEDLAFTFANLGLIKRAMGQSAASEALFRKALNAARLHQHRNLAPVMTDLADLLCQGGRQAEAAALLREARPIMTRTYPGDAWRVAWIDNVQGGCLVQQGRLGEAQRLLGKSQRVLSDRWPVDSLYGHAARERMRDLDVALRKSGAIL
ncbi:toll/interleukin-1 receptor domain-containing protein [uncultured Phenylobacterium sp.]|uniref:toll/interleukin-1 receptor domain-containing protein n=1 Tax=uncultured Phenylobacterium sp. TaxID=349273 RepID=UPI0025DC9239|nr:toll/interleukin-1 receptor domain-containing protein [uncultured Phenylobacterium sp.]